MPIALNTTLRNARSTAIVTEAGATAKLSVYSAAYTTLLYTSTCAATLDGVTVAISQAARHGQSLSATLDGITASVSQTAQHPQTLAAQLDGVSVSLSQSVAGTNSQALAITLEDVSVLITQISAMPAPSDSGGGGRFGPIPLAKPKKVNRIDEEEAFLLLLM